MTTFLLITFGAFLLSMVCGFIFIPWILNYCKLHQLYDIPNQRKMHHTFVPRLGGVSFLPSMMLAFVAALFVAGFNPGREITLHLWTVYFLIGILIIYCTGIVDDVLGVSPRTKFIAQIVAACCLPLAGLYVNNLYGLFGIEQIPAWAAMPLTVFIIVFIVNAVNLIDGIDGLCAGLCIIALAGYFIVFGLQNILTYCILIAGIIGVLTAYLYFNLFGKTENNRKIFMGDSGSLTLGFILAFLFVKYAMDNPHVMPYRKDGLLLSSTFLIIPVFDVVRLIFVRSYHRQPIFGADKNHVHHKLMRAGLSQHQALAAILLLAVGYIALNFSLGLVLSSTWVVVIDIVIFILFQLTVNVLIRKRGAQPFVLNPERNE